MGYFDAPYRPADLTVDSSHSLVSGMQAWFPLTEGSGTSVQCILHSSHTGTLSGTTAWVSESKGTSLQTDGATGRSNASVSINNAYPLSMATWFKCTTLTSQSQTAVGIADSSVPNNQHRITVSNATGTLIANSFGAGGSSSATGSTNVGDGVWHFGVAVFESATSRKIYVDGVLEATDTTTVAMTALDRVSIGVSADSTPGTWFDGEIQNVKIYSRALSATEIASLYTRPWTGTNYDTEALWLSPPASPALSTASESTSIMADIEGWWVMTDGSGTTLTDISGNGRDATLNGTNTWETETLGTANRFDNSVSRTSHAETANTQPDLTGGYTFSTWVKHEEVGLTSSNIYGGGIVLGNSSGSSDIEIYFQGKNNTAQYPQVFHNRSNGGTVGLSQGSRNKSDDNGVWVNYVVTYDGSTVLNYRNSNLYRTTTSVAAPLSTSGYKIYLNELPVVANNGGLTCSMQNTRLYSRALSDSEISLLYERPWIGAEYNETAPLYPPVPSNLTPLDSSSSILTSLAGWWPLTETDNFASGAADISGNSKTFTKVGTVISAASRLGGSSNFDGSGDYLQNTTVTTSAFPWTLSAWGYYSGNGTNTDTLLSLGCSTSDTPYCFIFFNNTAGTAGGATRCSATGWPTQTITSSITAGNWYHLVWVQNSQTSSEFYVNGVSVGTDTTNLNSAPTPALDQVQAGILDRTTASNDMLGRVQNCRLWSRALSSTEIANIYYSPWLGSSVYPPTGGGTPSYFVAAQFNRLGIGPRFRRL